MSGYWRTFKVKLRLKEYKAAWIELREFLNGGDREDEQRETDAERCTRERREEAMRTACKCYSARKCTQRDRPED